ncbi:MAG TPA: FHA domain-containing protein, partial [Kofleriaceae bacterium]|nr:FHA domain-containing protein [Kofleriaceae bacterium]
MSEISTNADPGATGWAIRDGIVRLRVFASERSYELAGAENWVLGTAPDCSIQLDDATGRVSRRHACIEWREGAFVISDLGSTNGIRQDGEDRKAFPLAPGVEVDLGGVKLIAESP